MQEHVFHSYIHLYNMLQTISEEKNFLQERFPIITVLFVLKPTIPLSFFFLCLLQLAVCMLYNPKELPEKGEFFCKNMLLVIKPIYIQHFKNLQHTLFVGFFL